MAACTPTQQHAGLHHNHMHQLPGHSIAQALGQSSSSHVSREGATNATGLSRTQRQCRRLWQRRSRKALQAQAHLSNGSTSVGLSGVDLQHLQRAAEVADSSAGLSQPHPNCGCILVGPDGRHLAQSYLTAQGTPPAEVQAIAAASGHARGSTAYLNMETGDCHGDSAGLSALIGAGVSRVVVGIRHPLTHSRGLAIKELRQHGVQVDVLGEAACFEAAEWEDRTIHKCLAVNEALLHRAALQRPLGIFKYAMTMDGKIATSMGHSAWVSSSLSRQQVFETRARSDAVIVGGQTVRLDNPRLTTRREGGHMPMRIVMSRTLDLQEDANLWDVSIAPTIVMTQRGARSDFQRQLRARGVEVVEFDFLTPHAVAAYCYERGFLQCLWECGGTLAAPAIAAGVIHKTLAFIAPKLIGGVRAPSPVGELGNVEMTQALNIVEPHWQASGPDMLLTGYLPTSGGLEALDATLSGQPQPAASRNGTSASPAEPALTPALAPQGQARRRDQQRCNKAVRFYKAWDRYGSLSNFSCHSVHLPDEPLSDASAAQQSVAPLRSWQSVEHYYQAQKFASPEGNPEARAVIELIANAASPEEAAKTGRRFQRQQPALVRSDWDGAKLEVMLAALRAKFGHHDGPRKLLLSTAREESTQLLQESSPSDFFWAAGVDGTGCNHLGRLLMQVREELQSGFQGTNNITPTVAALT